MSEQPAKRGRLRVVDVPSTPSSARRPSRPSGGQGGRNEFGGGDRSGRKKKDDFERQTHAVRNTPERKAWDEATKGIMSIHGRPFDPTRTYTEQDIILHKKLGLGIVESVEDDNSAISVLFRDGVEVLKLGEEE